jgi:hypothetical protein
VSAVLLQQLHRFAQSIDNPLDGIVPDFGVFGVEFTELWQKLIAAIWGICIVIGVVVLLLGITRMASASNSQNPNEYRLARLRVAWAALSLGLLAAISVIVGAILALFG